MKMSESCAACLLGKNISRYPREASPKEIEDYQTALRAVIEENKHLSAPEVVEAIGLLRCSMFGSEPDYGRIKEHYNQLMLAAEPTLLQNVGDAEDSFLRAVQYAMAGNYIDFGALDEVGEEKLRKFLSAADEMAVDTTVLEMLKEDLKIAKRLVYLTDNCGEIVADKVFLHTVMKKRPDLHVTVILRGAPVLNDATLADAEQVGLSTVATEVIDNGTAIAGTVLSRLSERARTAIECADLLIAKGQGNYESLCGCGLNMYYIFLCKCDLFVKRFGLPQFTGVLTKEKRSEE